MPVPETNFDGVAADFAAYAEDVRGYVRYSLAQRNILDFIGNKEHLTVADIGGGSAIDATWLAKLDHNVLVVEPSEEQIEKSKKRLSDAQSSKGCVEFHHGTMEDILPSRIEEFDLVLSHCVAMYIPDKVRFIGQLAMLTKPGGLISIMEKGFYGHEARLIQGQAPLARLRQFQESQEDKNNLNRTRYAFYPEELERIILQSGAKILDWRGIRVISDMDNRKTVDIKPDMLQAIVDAEYRHGKQPHIRGFGQMLHFIAQK